MPSRMVSVSASVNLPLHHKVQKFSSGIGSPGWSWKKGRKMVVVWWYLQIHCCLLPIKLFSNHVQTPSVNFFALNQAITTSDTILKSKKKDNIYEWLCWKSPVPG